MVPIRGLSPLRRKSRLVPSMDIDFLALWTTSGQECQVFAILSSRVVCGFQGLEEFLRRNVVDEVVIYLPFASFYRLWSEVASLCVHHGIIVRLNSDTFGLQNARWLAEEVDGGHYIATHTGAGEGWPLAVKRTLDLTVSSVLLVLLGADPIWNCNRNQADISRAGVLPARSRWAE